MQLIQITSATASEVTLVKSSEVNEMVDWLRANLAELKGYFTKEEQESWCPAYLKAYSYALDQVAELARMKCRNAEAMARRGNMLARCDKELGQYTADYLAAIDG